MLYDRSGEKKMTKRSNIPTWDLFVEGQEEAVLQGVHKTHANKFKAQLEKNGLNCTLTQSKADKSSRFSKHRKDRKWN